MMRTWIWSTLIGMLPAVAAAASLVGKSFSGSEWPLALLFYLAPSFLFVQILLHTWARHASAAARIATFLGLSIGGVAALAWMSRTYVVNHVHNRVFDGYLASHLLDAPIRPLPLLALSLSGLYAIASARSRRSGRALEACAFVMALSSAWILMARPGLIIGSWALPLNLLATCAGAWTLAMIVIACGGRSTSGAPPASSSGMGFAPNPRPSSWGRRLLQAAWLVAALPVLTFLSCAVGIVMTPPSVRENDREILLLVYGCALVASPFAAITSLVLPLFAGSAGHEKSEALRLWHPAWLGAVSAALGLALLTLLDSIERPDALPSSFRWLIYVSSLPMASALVAASTLLAVVTMPSRLRASPA